MFLAFALASQTWTLAVGGDIMLNGIAPSDKVFEGVAPWFKGADIATANLEIPLTDTGNRTTRKTAADIKARRQFVLKADPDHVSEIAATGFDLVGIANNHAMDYGKSGLAQMTGLLDKHRISHCGAAGDADAASAPVVVKTRNGLKVAFVAFLAFRTEGGLWTCTPATADTPGVATLGQVQPENGSRGGSLGIGTARPFPATVLKKLKSVVTSARRAGDVVVVWLHWGTERNTVPDPFQVQLARAFVEAGADCVLGAHPHVLQGGEVYAGRPVFYSLGNLVSPLPAETAVFRLVFDGRRFVRSEMLPCLIRGGKVVPFSQASRGSGLTRFQKLGRAAVAKFPHPKSRPMAPG